MFIAGLEANFRGGLNTSLAGQAGRPAKNSYFQHKPAETSQSFLSVEILRCDKEVVVKLLNIKTEHIVKCKYRENLKHNCHTYCKI